MPVSKPDCPYALQRKAREIPPRCRAVLSPQSGLLRKNREKWASFAYFEGKAGGISLQLRIAGGESGIRTHVTLSSKHAFQACAFSHSAISPANLGTMCFRKALRRGRYNHTASFHSMGMRVTAQIEC